MKWACVGAAMAAMAATGAQAQAVYKCNPSSYSEQPCSTRIVRTFQAPAEAPKAKPHDVIAHRLPGETPQEFATRKRRVGLTESDRDECARLDKRIAFERERMKSSPHDDEIDDSQATLEDSRKRYRQLRC